MYNDIQDLKKLVRLMSEKTRILRKIKKGLTFLKKV